MPTTSESDNNAASSVITSQIDRVREPANHATVAELMDRRRSEGWSLVAVEWEWGAAASSPSGRLHSTEVPYGLQVAHDFLHLVENPLEVEAMILVLDSMVDDRGLSDIATALNQRGLRNRQDEFWTQGQVFDLMPRIVEAAPDIFGTPDWQALRLERKKRQLRAV